MYTHPSELTQRGTRYTSLAANMLKKQREFSHACGSDGASSRRLTPITEWYNDSRSSAGDARKIRRNLSRSAGVKYVDDVNACPTIVRLSSSASDKPDQRQNKNMPSDTQECNAQIAQVDQENTYTTSGC